MSDPIATHFGLTRPPFTVDYDTENMVLFSSFQQGLLRLRQAAVSRGAALVVGEPGTGKTALVRSVVKRLQPSGYKVLEQLVPCTKSPGRAVVEGLLSQLGEQLPFNNPPRAIKLLQQSLLSIADKQRTPVVILDDVHHLSPTCWLSLKALMNHDLDSRQPLLLLFLGGPSTLRVLNSAALVEVRDRLSFCYYLQGLQNDEVLPYLEKRLKWAGCTHALFPEDIAAELAQHADGLPRRVNRLANACLLAAATLDRKLIDRECLKAALSELQFQPPQREEHA